MKSESTLSLKIWALAANSGTALASVVLGLMVLHGSGVTDYGVFAFILVLQWLGCGLINALCGAPLLIGYRDHLLTPAQIRPFFWLSLAVILLIAVLQSIALYLQQIAWLDVFIFCFAVSCQLLRWFSRSYLQNTEPTAVLKADASFTLTVLPLCALVIIFDSADLTLVGLVLMTGSIIALLPLRQFLREQFSGPCKLDFFRQSMHRQAKPALVGVVTVEATSNAHTYLIMFLLGSAALAPIAAAALFLRPMTLFQSSISQIEKPRLAKAIAAGDAADIRQTMTMFYRYSCYAFFANVAVFGLLAVIQPVWLWPDLKSWSLFLEIAVLVIFTNLLRTIRSPSTVLAQCFDEFNFLARVTVVSSVITIPLVVLLLWYFGVLGALSAILIGELLITILTVGKSRQCFVDLKLQSRALSTG